MLSLLRADDGPTRMGGAVIGRYRLRRLIASGGMGTVYEAMQESPRRRVALKVMKRGLASRSALRRFEFESELLGRLRHPGIAQIHEAGIHDDGSGDGVPDFAMAAIGGVAQLITVSEIGVATTWDTQTWAAVRRIDLSLERGPFDAAISPHGEYLATAGSLGPVVIHDLDSGTKVAEILSPAPRLMRSFAWAGSRRTIWRDGDCSILSGGEDAGHSRPTRTPTGQSARPQPGRTNSRRDSRRRQSASSSY